MGSNRQWNTFWRITKSGMLNLFRNAWLTIAATAVMMVALIIILLAVVLNVTARNAIDELAKNLKASIYLADDVSEKDRNKVQAVLREQDFVQSVEYISSDQAAQDLASDFNNDADILQAYALVGDEQVLPASFRVSVVDLARMSEIEEVAKRDDIKSFISKVSLGQTDAKKTIDRAAATQRFITVGSIIASGALTFVSIMIIFNTIRMAIYTRREEIRIMKLIGGTPGYIRGPFLVEASLYGVMASIIATSIVYTIVTVLGSKVADQPEFAQTYDFFTAPFTIVSMSVSAMFVGILIGVVSSMLAMEKHLKLKNW